MIYQVTKMDERERDHRSFFSSIFSPACLLVSGRLPSLEGRVGRRGWRAGGRRRGRGSVYDSWK